MECSSVAFKGSAGRRCGCGAYIYIYLHYLHLSDSLSLGAYVRTRYERLLTETALYCIALYSDHALEIRDGIL